MLIMSILVIVIFIWLILNHPFKGEHLNDTYKYFLESKNNLAGEEEEEEEENT